MISDNTVTNPAQCAAACCDGWPGYRVYAVSWPRTPCFGESFAQVPTELVVCEAHRNLRTMDVVTDDLWTALHDALEMFNAQIDRKDVELEYRSVRQGE